MTSPEKSDSNLNGSTTKAALRAMLQPGVAFAMFLLLGINLFNYMDRYVLAAMEPRIQSTLFPGRENDPIVLGEMGSLATWFIVSYMVAAPILGWLADRYSRWMLVGIGVIFWSLATGGSGLATTFTILVATRMLVGVGEAGYGPAAPTIIADLFPLENRGTAMAWFYMAIPVGSALGYVIGGQIGAHFGWRTAFFAVVPPGLLLGILCFFRKETSQSRDRKKVEHKASLADFTHILKTPSYLLDTLGMAAMTFAIGGISYWMPRYVAEFRKAGELGHVNLIFGAMTAIAGLSATLLGGIVGDKLRQRYSGAYFIVSGVGILMSCPFILLMLVVPFPRAYGCIFLAEFFLFFNTGPSNTILANVTSPAVRASAFAMNILIIHAVGDAPSPMLLGYIVGAHGWNAAFGLVTAVTALGGVLWLIATPFLQKDTDAITSLG